MTFDAFSKMIVDNYRAVLLDEYRLDDNYKIDASLGDNDLCPDRTNYNQLKERAIKIIESNSYVLWSLRQVYSHIFIDEFQDTTDIQYRLIRKLAYIEIFVRFQDCKESSRISPESSNRTVILL